MADFAEDKVLFHNDSLSPSNSSGGLKATDLAVPPLTRPDAARHHFRLRSLVVIETRNRGFDVEFQHRQRLSAILPDGRIFAALKSAGYKPVARLIRAVEKAFPLLDFSCWSTAQINAYTHHLLAHHTAFLYAEADTLESVADTLRDQGWDAFANPKQAEVSKHFRPGDRAVVLRPSISKQPPGDGHLAPVEKLLVDLAVEAPKLNLMDETEVQRVVTAILNQHIVQVSVLQSYAERRSVIFDVLK